MRDEGAAIRREQLRLLLVGVPAVVVAYVLAGRIGSFSDRPWLVTLALLPLLLVVVALGWPLVRDRRMLLGGGFLGFWVSYCLLFTVAAETHLLDGRRVTLGGFEAETPSNALGLNWLGDWHYSAARAAPPATDLLVVTLPSFEGRPAEEARRVQAGLIRTAVQHAARGIAFDYFLERPSAADRVLCFWIERAEAAGIPVVYGYRVEDDEPVPMTASVAACVPPARQGTLQGLREADGVVRMVPSAHGGDTTYRSFSHRIAALLAGGTDDLPDVGLVQYVEPTSGPHRIDGEPDAAEAESFRGRFVLVGSYRPGDVHATPYGRLEGVFVHAFAAHGLRSNHVIRRLDAAWLLPAILLLCYLVTLLQSKGGGPRALLLAAVIITAGVLAAAALAMRAGLVWIDASYPIVAVWALAAMLSGGAALQQGRLRAVPMVAEIDGGAQSEGGGVEPERDGARGFDVFLSHNSKDDPAVRELASMLRERRLRVWLDEWELVPGRPWQQAIEEAIRTCASAAVLVGSDGIGPWEEPEMRACLDECVRRRMPVIPVLLPRAAAEPPLPLFLKQFTWVDLRGGIDAEALDRLEWGITGVKPRRR